MELWLECCLRAAAAAAAAAVLVAPLLLREEDCIICTAWGSMYGKSFFSCFYDETSIGKKSFITKRTKKSIYVRPDLEYQ
jgi:hypothetical protein